MKRPINQSGLDPEQKVAGATPKINLPADWKPTAKVSFKEVPPDADQLVQHLRKDPARYTELVVKYSKRQIEDAPYVQKGKKRGELETKTIVPANQKKQREKDAKYQEIRDLAGDIRAKFPLRSAYALARQINKLYPTRFKIRTIQRALKK
jgi:hypothetical protein